MCMTGEVKETSNKKLWKYNVSKIKSDITLSNKILQKFNNEFNDNIHAEIVALTDKEGVITVRNNKISLNFILFRDNKLGTVKLKFPNNKNTYDITMSGLKSLICIPIATYIAMGGKPLDVEIISLKTIGGVNMRFIKYNNLYAWIEANALVIANENNLLSCANLRLTKSGRISSTNKIVSDKKYNKYEGHRWVNLDMSR